MKKIKESEYHNVESLLKNSDSTPPTFAFAVIEKIVQGEVYIDNEDSPKTALLGTDSGIYLIIGDETNPSFNNGVAELFYNRTAGGKRFTLFSSSKIWDEIIRGLLQGRITFMKRYSFTFNPDRFPKEEVTIPKVYSLQRINKSTIEKSPGFNDSYYREYWGSTSNFLKKGLGFCVICGDTVVCVCTAIFKSKRFAEIDIETHKDFRGQGLSYLAGKEFIKACMDNNIVPRWDCDVSNVASIKLANKLGFEGPVEYSIFVEKKE